MKPNTSLRERLIIFGRLPEAGYAKKRLAVELGDAGAADLYQAFLDDAVAWDVGVASSELWIPERPGGLEILSRRYPGIPVRNQPPGSLGAKLSGAFQRAFEDGVDHAVIVGSDHPTLPPGLLAEAFRALRAAHLVLGPAHDGGYYAIGLRRYAWPGASGLFDGAPWSTPQLLAWTRDRAKTLDLCHVELPTWYDVDRPEDLERMAADLRPDSRTAETWGRLREALGAGERTR